MPHPVIPGRTQPSLLAAILLLFGRTVAPAQAAAGLQAAVAQAGGRVILTLKSTRTGVEPALMAPGSPAVSAQELDQISSHLTGTFAVTVLKSLPATSMLVATIQPSQLGVLLADSNV